MQRFRKRARELRAKETGVLETVLAELQHRACL